ncbi:MAG: histidine kinase dimerization/phospho-acceptor domain-containing protein [Solirubrobacterales bacterium]
MRRGIRARRAAGAARLGGAVPAARRGGRGLRDLHGGPRRQDRELECRRQTDQGRKAYEDELARSNANLEVFAGVTSHDLREPLQLVTAFAELLDEQPADADTDTRRLVERSGRAARRMREMLDGVRAWSRVGGPSARGMQDVDLTELTADVVDTLGPRWPSAGSRSPSGRCRPCAATPPRSARCCRT